MIERRKPRGHVRVWGPSGLLVVDKPNLIVNAGLNAMAAAFSFPTVAADAPAILGWGSGSTSPAITDTDLGASPKYYNALVSSSLPGGIGTVQYNFQLASTEYAAVGMTITEIGLFANSASAVFPSAVGFTYGSWAGTHAEAVGTTVSDGSGHVFSSVAPPAWVASTVMSSVAGTGQLITDSNGNIQRCTTGGTTKSGTHPTWGVTLSSTTTDNTATWTCVALSGYTPTTGSGSPSWVTTAIGAFTWDGTVAWTYEAANNVPATMVAHVLVPSFPFSGVGSYTGSWSVTF